MTTIADIFSQQAAQRPNPMALFMQLYQMQQAQRDRSMRQSQLAFTNRMASANLKMSKDKFVEAKRATAADEARKATEAEMRKLKFAMDTAIAKAKNKREASELRLAWMKRLDAVRKTHLGAIGKVAGGIGKAIKFGAEEGRRARTDARLDTAAARAAAVAKRKTKAYDPFRVRTGVPLSKVISRLGAKAKRTPGSMIMLEDMGRSDPARLERYMRKNYLALWEKLLSEKTGLSGGQQVIVDKLEALGLSLTGATKGKSKWTPPSDDTSGDI